MKKILLLLMVLCNEVVQASLDLKETSEEAQNRTSKVQGFQEKLLADFCKDKEKFYEETDYNKRSSLPVYGEFISDHAPLITSNSRTDNSIVYP